MPRLGAVVGGILAELAQARLIADRLTRELVQEYEADPVLSTMAVPRVSIGGASIRLRFVVDDIVEPEQPKVDVNDAVTVWNGFRASGLIPRLMSTPDLSASQKVNMGAVLTTPIITKTAMGAALGGNKVVLVDAASEGIMEQWDALDTGTKRSLGGKDAFRRAVASAVREEVDTFVERLDREAAVRSALRSQTFVGVVSSDLAQEGERVHELELTITSQDLDVIVEGEDGSR